MEQKITGTRPMENKKEFADLYAQLTDGERQEMLEYMRFLLKEDDACTKTNSFA